MTKNISNICSTSCSYLSWSWEYEWPDPRKIIFRKRNSYEFEQLLLILYIKLNVKILGQSKQLTQISHRRWCYRFSFFLLTLLFKLNKLTQLYCVTISCDGHLVFRMPEIPIGEISKRQMNQNVVSKMKSTIYFLFFYNFHSFIFISLAISLSSDLLFWHYSHHIIIIRNLVAFRSWNFHSHIWNPFKLLKNDFEEIIFNWQN